MQFVRKLECHKIPGDKRAFALNEVGGLCLPTSLDKYERGPSWLKQQ